MEAEKEINVLVSEARQAMYTECFIGIGRQDNKKLAMQKTGLNINQLRYLISKGGYYKSSILETLDSLCEKIKTGKINE